MTEENPFRIGVDIGGTFTDIVLLGGDGTIHTKKISSSTGDYARAIVDGLDEVFRETGLTGGDVDQIRHGTTVASNAILEGKGARVGLITTAGFPGCSRTAHAQDAAALRHVVGEAAAAGGTLSAPHRR